INQWSWHLKRVAEFPVVILAVSGDLDRVAVIALLRQHRYAEVLSRIRGQLMITDSVPSQYAHRERQHHARYPYRPPALRLYCGHGLHMTHVRSIRARHGKPPASQRAPYSSVGHDPNAA